MVLAGHCCLAISIVRSAASRPNEVIVRRGVRRRRRCRASRVAIAGAALPLKFVAVAQAIDDARVVLKTSSPAPASATRGSIELSS